MKQYTSRSYDCHATGIGQAMAEHERLVHWVVRRQWLGPLSFAEALQVGRIALWRALERFDGRRGTRFSTYAVPIIERDIWRAVARAKPHPLEILTPHPPQEPPDLEETVQSTLLREAVHQLLLCLPFRLARVVAARHGLSGSPPETFQAIGDSLGVTRQRAHQLHIEALLWLGHPARSLQLRRLLGRNALADYQAYLARLRRWQRGWRKVS
jgi:RNA polymerase sigma factor (sigma-70 family)